jgi:hypothetical protein
MDDRVKCILLLLGEEADSFAKRAEMYYQRRPEVISSVEEAYRAYRALAERYDHMSGELHKANHTVATAFPDQVQYSMLEEDDDSLPKAFTTVDPRKIRKSTVEGLMKKKKGDKSGPKGEGANSAGSVNKDNAQSEISRKQKEILVLQTEKEFIKSSYESGIAKYWDLEKQINDMHEEVCYFQEEFSESAVIEDDEARALMTASALKSCEDTISKLQEQQKLSFSQAMVELERANVSRDKLKNIMKEHGKVLSDSGNSLYENAANDASVEMDDVYSMKQQKIEMEAIVDKIKEYFQKDTDISVAEIAEKIDDIVNKVVDLELMVSSQTAKIDRLCLENTELEKSLHELEEVKAVVTSGSGELNEKLEKAEDELMRVQYLESSFHEEESIVYSNFAETVTSFCDITDMLQSPLIEHQTDPVPTQTDEAIPSNHTEPSGECEKIKPEDEDNQDKATQKAELDGFADCSGKSDLAIINDDSEDLWPFETEGKSRFAAPSVDKGTEENADNDAFGEHGNKEVEYAHGVIDSSMLPHVIHSHEQGSLDLLDHISYEGLRDQNLKQVDDKQDSSSADHTISGDHSERKINKVEESENSNMTENSTPENVIVPSSDDQEENMANLQQIPMSGLQGEENVSLGECKKHDPKEDPLMDKATQKPDIDGFTDSSIKSELAIISDDSKNLWHFELEGKSNFVAPAESADNNPFGEYSNMEVEYVHGVIGSGMQPHVIHSHEQGSLDQLHHNLSEGSLNHNLKKAGDKQDSSTADHNIFEGHAKQDINHAEDSENSYITGNRDVIGSEDQEETMATLQHFLMSGLQDKEKLSLTECEKQDPEIDLQMDKDTRKPAIDGFPDWSPELDLEIFSHNKQPSDGYHESMAEKHYRADDLEDLWHCGLESKSSLTAASVSKEISDEDASGEHNNKEVEYVHETVGNLGSSMQPYAVHSCEQGSLDQLHNISTDVPQDHDLKKVDDKQDLSTAVHSISEGHSEKEMNKAEESENTRTTENSTPGNGKVVDAGDQEENMANLQELLMSGLQDKEKVLLTEYTSILRNYKNAKRSLTEMEIKNEECLNEMKAMMSELRCANELKDKEIQSLRELLNSSTDKDAHHSGHHINTSTSLSFKSGSFRGQRRIPSFLPVHQRRQSASCIQNSSPKNNANHESHMEDDASHDAVLDPESIVLGDHRLTNILEMENASPLEDKFRRDIDGLLGENLEFWMKFSTSFQKIQEFQTKHDQLQSEIGKIVNEDKLKVNSGRASDPPAKAESEAIEKQLRELKIDMQVWLEQNAMFKGELHYRFSSLCSIQEEIQAAMEMDAETEEGIQFTSYHAAKFQGEILNMKQENNKVADELQAGLDHIRGLQGQIEKVIPKILNSPSLSASKGFGTWRNTPSKSRVPLRSFLFPAKKKKSSLLACMNPALQKQHSDMAFFAKME